MPIILNFMTLCEYFIRTCFGFGRVGSVKYDCEADCDDDDDDDTEPLCYCNLCNSFRNMSLFFTHRLRYIEVSNN